MASLHGDAPSAFICPISSEIMVDPVIVVGSAQTAGRDAVTRWFAEGNARCPVTNVKLRTPLMIPNHALAAAIEEWTQSEGKRIPSAFLCPLSKRTLLDPVTIVESRQTVDSAAAAKWIKSGNYRCPVSKVLMRERGYIQNFALKKAIEEWKEVLKRRGKDTSPACDTAVDAFHEALEIESAAQITDTGHDAETARNLLGKRLCLMSAFMFAWLIIAAAFLAITMMVKNTGTRLKASGEPFEKEVVSEESFPSKDSRLLQAVQEGNARYVTILLNEGADVNTFDSSGRTPLFFAAVHGYSEIATILLDRGADPDAQHIRGETALMSAIDHEKFEVAHILISGGSNVNSSSEWGWTPLIYAVMSVIRQLNILSKAEGADVEAHDVDGWTPLIWAATDDDRDLVKLLINSGARVAASTLNSVGNVPSLSTSLHVAAKNGCLKVTETLLIADADKQAKNSAGKTAKEMVCRHCQERTRLLKILE